MRPRQTPPPRAKLFKGSRAPTHRGRGAVFARRYAKPVSPFRRPAPHISGRRHTKKGAHNFGKTEWNEPCAAAPGRLCGLPFHAAQPDLLRRLCHYPDVHLHLPELHQCQYARQERVRHLRRIQQLCKAVPGRDLPEGSGQYLPHRAGQRADGHGLLAVGGLRHL